MSRTTNEAPWFQRHNLAVHGKKGSFPITDRPTLYRELAICWRFSTPHRSIGIVVQLLDNWKCLPDRDLLVSLPTVILKALL